MGIIRPREITRVKRSLSLYLKSGHLKSNSGKKCSKYALDSFSLFLDKFHEITPDESIESFKDQQIAIDTLQSWIDWFSTTEKRVSSKKGDWHYTPKASTTFQYFHIIIRYLHYMGIKFHPYDLKREITLPRPLQEDKHGITKAEILLILDNCSFEKKALYLAQLSSGMRIGELVQLRKKHLDFNHERIVVRIPAEFTKLRKSRVTFFSREFDKLFRAKLNKCEDNDLLFGTNENWEKARDNEIDNMINLRKRIGLKDVSTHNFRAWFITKLSRFDSDLVKILVGHKGYQLSYQRMDIPDKLAIYLKHESEFAVYEIITNSEKEKDLQSQISKLSDKIKRLEDMNEPYDKSHPHR